MVVPGQHRERKDKGLVYKIISGGQTLEVFYPLGRSYTAVVKWQWGQEA